MFHSFLRVADCVLWIVLFIFVVLPVTFLYLSYGFNIAFDPNEPSFHHPLSGD